MPFVNSFQENSIIKIVFSLQLVLIAESDVAVLENFNCYRTAASKRDATIPLEKKDAKSLINVRKSALSKCSVSDGKA